MLAKVFKNLLIASICFALLSSISVQGAAAAAGGDDSGGAAAAVGDGGEEATLRKQRNWTLLIGSYVRILDEWKTRCKKLEPLRERCTDLERELDEARRRIGEQESNISVYDHAIKELSDEIQGLEAKIEYLNGTGSVDYNPLNYGEIGSPAYMLVALGTKNLEKFFEGRVALLKNSGFTCSDAESMAQSDCDHIKSDPAAFLRNINRQRDDLHLKGVNAVEQWNTIFIPQKGSASAAAAAGGDGRGAGSGGGGDGSGGCGAAAAAVVGERVFCRDTWLRNPDAYMLIALGNKDWSIVFEILKARYVGYGQSDAHAEQYATSNVDDMRRSQGVLLCSINVCRRALRLADVSSVDQWNSGFSAAAAGDSGAGSGGGGGDGSGGCGAAAAAAGW